MGRVRKIIISVVAGLIAGTVAVQAQERGLGGKLAGADLSNSFATMRADIAFAETKGIERVVVIDTPQPPPAPVTFTSVVTPVAPIVPTTLPTINTPQPVIATPVMPTINASVVGHPNKQIFASAGSRMSGNNMQEGRAFVCADKHPVVVTTCVGKVRVEPGTKALIEVAPGKMLKVSGLVGDDSQPGIELLTTEGESVTLPTGQQLMVALNNEEELIPIEGGSMINAKIELKNHRAAKVLIDPNTFMDEEVLVAGTAIKLSTLSHHRPVAAYAAVARTASWFVPVGNNEAGIWHDGGAVAKVNGNQIQLGNGTVCIANKEAMVIDGTFCKLEVGKNAIFTMSKDANHCRIQIIDGPVTIHAGDRSVKVLPGTEYVVSQAGSQVNKHPADGIGRRFFNVNNDCGKGITMSVCDFDPMSLVSTSTWTHQVKKVIFGNKGHETRFLKTTAAIRQVTRYRGAYTYGAYDNDILAAAIGN